MINEKQKSAYQLIFCYTRRMRIPEFIFLALMTSLSTYWMNQSFLTGSYFWAGVFAFIVLRNLYFSYKVSRFIRVVETITKKKG
jgi:hypothetical protein